ncbi:MAG: hypothetical protein P8L18_05950 [Verrucomicrobiota bacterium]|nr:hypothetical protein [Verrucomicrobiota bacterium]
MSFELIFNTFVLTVGVSLTASLTGVMTALGASLTSPRIRKAMVVASILNLVLPQFLVLMWWMGLFGEAGTLRPWVHWNLYSLPGAIWIMTLLYWPIPFMCVLGSIERIPRSMLEVDPFMRNIHFCRHLLWPNTKPALMTATMVVAALTLNQFNVPSLLQLRTWTADILVTFSATLEWREIQNSVLSLILGSCVILYYLRPQPIAWPFESTRVRRTQLGCQFDPYAAMALKLWGWTWIMLATLFPCLGMIISAATWRELIPAALAGQSALNHSAGLGYCIASVCLLFGMAIHRWSMGKMLWILFLVPGSVWGVLFLTLTQQNWFPFKGSSLFLAIAAQSFKYTILGWTGARLAISAIDRDLRDAARMEIESGLRRAWKIYLPQVGWMIGACWYVIFLLCLWDADSLLFVMPPGAETLALRIFNLLHYGHNSQVNALSMLLLLVALSPWVVWQIWKLSAWILGDAWGRWKTRCLPVLLMTPLLSGCFKEPLTKKTGETLLDSAFFERAVIIGTRGRSPGHFIKPRSLTVDGNDMLYVVDMTGRVQKFDHQGHYLLQWQMPELDRGKPKGMCVDMDGNIVVVEPHYARVNHFTSMGKLLFQWGVKGKQKGALTFPRAATVQSSGKLVIGEYQSAERIQWFSRDGSKFLGTVGTAGHLDGQFNRPEGLASNERDDIFVADSCNHRIQVLDAEGKWLRSFGTAGQDHGELSYPYDVKVDRANHLFVCEFGNSRIQIFDPEDRSVEILGGPGDAPGQFNNPWSIALDSKGNLYVADSANHRVQKLMRSPHLKTPTSKAR